MPPWLLYTLGVLIFAFGLLLSIALHEIGHMVPAKKFGVKVTQYMVGFGPTLWSRKRGDTEYGIKAIPLGGYIRMIGMVPPRADGKRSRWPRRLASAVEDFRQVSRAEVDPADRDREFYRLTPGKKMIVMLGGPSMNLLIYFILTLILLMTLGTAHDDPTTKVGAVVKCVVPANSKDAGSAACPAGAKNAPAFNKLKPGDRILSVDSIQITSWNQLVEIVELSPGVPLAMVVDRDGAQRTINITPVENIKYTDNTLTKTRPAGYLGVSSLDHHYYEGLSIGQVPGQIGSQIKLGLHAFAQYPAKNSNLWDTVFEGKKRDVNGAVGVVGIGRISGDFARSPLLTAQDKIYTLIGLLASVNLLLFLFNLLPLLPLDGGHVAGAIVESIKRGRARLRARGQPAVMGADGVEAPPAHKQIFVDTAQMLPVMYAVASVLVLLTLLTLYADIVKPINPLGG
jgi:membrane-associated protease RseP (regulator of RpoE activity)